MNTESITQSGEELLVETPSLGSLWFLPGLLYRQLQTARRVEREAMRLYVMADAELSARGYSREGIRDQLLEAYDD